MFPLALTDIVWLDCYDQRANRNGQTGAKKFYGLQHLTTQHIPDCSDSNDKGMPIIAVSIEFFSNNVLNQAYQPPLYFQTSVLSPGTDTSQ